MEDAMAAGAWPEKENPNTTRINEIIDYVKQVGVDRWLSGNPRTFFNRQFSGFIEPSVFSPSKTKQACFDTSYR